MPLSVAQAQAFLNSLFGSGSPATWYLALFLTDSTGTAAGREVSGGAYARVAITNDNTKWTGATATSPSVVVNSGSITFPTPTANWGSVGFWGLMPAASGGTPTWSGELVSALEVTTGNPVVVAAGNLNLALG